MHLSGFQKLQETFWKVSGRFDEFRMNFVHAKSACFCVHEIHRKFIEASGKCPVVSGEFPGVSGNLPDSSAQLLGAWGAASGSLYRDEKGGLPKVDLAFSGRLEPDHHHPLPQQEAAWLVSAIIL